MEAFVAINTALSIFYTSIEGRSSRKAKI